MIRLLFVFLFLVFFYIISIPLLFGEWVVSLLNKNYKRWLPLLFVTWSFRCITAISGVKVTVFGEENVPKDEAVLYVGNHQSYFDIVLTYSRVPRRTGYMSKKELRYVPVIAQWMKYLHCLFLDRKNPRQGLLMVKQAAEDIKSGISFAIFPEGTRNTNPEVLLPFHKGSFKIAQWSNCLIVPIAINNTRNIFEAHLPAVKKQHVILEYGKPFRISDLDKTDQRSINTYTAGIIQEMVTKNQKLV